ncbi:MAG: hypothetical protein ACO3YZ_06125 [Candidatus Nanopelagicaceae bacterium]
MQAIIIATSDQVEKYQGIIEKVFGTFEDPKNSSYVVEFPEEQALKTLRKLEDEIEAMDVPPIKGLMLSILDDDGFFLEICD